MREASTPSSRWLAVKNTLQQWSLDGRVLLYDLDGKSMDRALEAAVKYRTRGADTTFVALADELLIPLKTFDEDVQKKYANSSAP